MARWRRVGSMHCMNLPAADPQLELSAVELRSTVQKLRPQHLLIPLASPLPIADLDIDVLYHRHPGHGCTSYQHRSTGHGAFEIAKGYGSIGNSNGLCHWPHAP